MYEDSNSSSSSLIWSKETIMKKLLLICGLSSIIGTLTAADFSGFNLRNKSDITQGGRYTFTNKRGTEMSIPIAPGSRENVINQVAEAIVDQVSKATPGKQAINVSDTKKSSLFWHDANNDVTKGGMFMFVDRIGTERGAPIKEGPRESIIKQVADAIKGSGSL